MNKNTIITKSIFSVAGLLLLAFSIKLFASTTSNIQKTQPNTSITSTILSFTSSSYDYLKGANNINPSIVINTDTPVLINGLNITYSVEGLELPTVIPPDLIIINKQIFDPKDCTTKMNETNKNILLTCYVAPTKLSSDDIVAFIDLDTVNKFAKEKNIKIKIKDSNSYITINSADQAISLKTNEFVINIIDIPTECLTTPNADINCDGKINSYDVMLFSTPNSNLESYIQYRLDLNQDKLINEKDKLMFDVALSILNNK